MTDDAQVLSERLLTALVGAAELFTVELGRELGLYAALRDRPLDAAELAKTAGIDERYAREWLEQQAAAGFLTVDGSAFTLASGAAEVLLDEGGPCFLGTAGEFAVGLGLAAPRVAEAFRTGAGIPYADYGRHIRHGIASFNRPMFDLLLTTEWLPAVPEVEARLRATPGARVLDLGCGTGRSSVALALAHPAITVRGIDLDEDSVTEARAAAATAGVADRVSFTLGDAADLDGEYDLVTVFEALHDMGDPVGVLRAVRPRLAPGGSVLIGDERVADEFTAPAGELERLQYAFSVLHCLPATRAEQPVIANGTILRAPTLLAWARDAGYERPEVLDIPNDFWRFYRLR
ncbi:bifunctional 2-polyprenyl-6-hydroxyphenol methylase/3-demethylubiquinol 3-O-methyltransferase UbiG [Actinoplanes sp. M2I2]|uniref:class I SAM-dependent methyltransferase n=1 Tax=Actinoplanes sp. M2I2 TaxID=1734444 RepID=UPI0020216083|nr:class I SAM-dependent methyltransferase [Actinoplanes sp. M2I2]